MNAAIQATGQWAGGQRRTVTRHTAAPAPPTRIWHRILGVTLSILKWAALAVLATLAAALALVSLMWGPTRWAVALLLVAIWVGLVALLVVAAARFRSGRAQLAAALGLVLLVPATVAISQFSAYTPPITDARGQVVPGSIATLEQVRLGGSEQWISIRGASTENPVLLWLAGGPGGSQLATARHHLRGLEDRFVVVNWEQPGAGKSYHAVPHAALTPERYIADGHELAQYLRRRFGEEKIYLVGESWGSALGLWLVQRYPELFHAFAGTGQMVAFLETDRLDYAFALRLARERGDGAKVAALERQGPPPYYGEGVAWKQAAYLLDGFASMNENPAIAADQFDTVQDPLSPEYGLYDKVNWARGVLDSLDVVYPQLWEVDFRKELMRLEVPVYFLIGRHDVNAPPALAEEYYRLLQAPRKEWIWFERSGHNPWVSESERFVDVVAGKLLTPRAGEGAMSALPLVVPVGADGRHTLPLHLQAHVGAPGDRVTVELDWQDGTTLAGEYPLRRGTDGRGLLIESLDWPFTGQRPPEPPTQPATVRVRDARGGVLAQQVVTMAGRPDTETVTLYWYKGETLQPEQRPLPPVGQEAARVALEELLWGPPPCRLAGYTTALPTPAEVLAYPGRQEGWGPRVTLHGLAIRDGVATADFSRELRAYGGGSARVQQIREQITQTLTQFPAVREVRIAVEGETAGVLEP